MGVFSVYLRIFVGNISKGEEYEKRKQEFLKALHYWKW